MSDMRDLDLALDEAFHDARQQIIEALGNAPATQRAGLTVQFRLRGVRGDTLEGTLSLTYKPADVSSFGASNRRAFEILQRLATPATTPPAGHACQPAPAASERATHAKSPSRFAKKKPQAARAAGHRAKRR